MFQINTFRTALTSRLQLSLICVLLFWMFVTTTVASEATQSMIPSEDDLKDHAWIERGQEIFVQSCAYCHGMRGDAGKTKSFTERESWPAEDIFNIISKGRVRGANRMPAWGGSIPDEDIWKIVAFIKSLSQTN